MRAAPQTCATMETPMKYSETARTLVMELNPNTTYDRFSDIDSAVAAALLFERRATAASYTLQALFSVLINILWVKYSWHEDQMPLDSTNTTDLLRPSGSQKAKARKSSARSNSVTHTASSYDTGSHTSAIAITFTKHNYSDHHNDGNEERPPKSIRMSIDEGSALKDKRLVPCHFHKQATVRVMDTSTSSNVYLKTCAGPGWKDIEKLRNHLESVYTSYRPLASRCTSFDTLFPDHVQLEQHHGRIERCSSMLDLSNNSISKSQWTQNDAAHYDFTSMQTSIENHLAHDPKFAPISKSLAEATWRHENSPFPQGITSCTASDDNNPEPATQPSTSSVSQQANSSSSMSTTQQPRKRLTDCSDGDDDDQDIPQPKRQKGPREPAEPDKPPKFSCHFHKRKPEVYRLRKSRWLTTQQQIKWRTCAGQGSKELRHLIKDDLSHHRIYDCDVCYQEFDTPDQYFAHEEDGRCIRHPGGGRERPQREGITQSQWRKIEKIAKNKDHQEKKWRDIWDILFPNDPQPRSPWASDEDNELGLLRFNADVEKVADMYRILVHGAISTEKLPSCTQETYEFHVRLMHKALRIVHDRKNQSSRTIPTPSSSIRIAQTPFVSESTWPGAQSSPSQEQISRFYKNMLTPAQSSPGSMQHRPSHVQHEAASFALSPNPSSTSERLVAFQDEYPRVVEQGKGSEQRTKFTKSHAQNSVPVNRSTITQQDLPAVEYLDPSHGLQPVSADLTNSIIRSNATQHEELLPRVTGSNVTMGEDALRRMEPNITALVEARVDSILAARLVQHQSNGSGISQQISTFPQVTSRASRVMSGQNIQNTYSTQSATMGDHSSDLMAWHPLPLDSRYSKQLVLPQSYSNFENFPDPNLHVGPADQSPFAICHNDFADSPSWPNIKQVNLENQINCTSLESLGSGKQSITSTMDSNPFTNEVQHYSLKTSTADTQLPTVMINPPSQLLDEGNNDLDTILGIGDNNMEQPGPRHLGLTVSRKWRANVSARRRKPNRDVN